MAAGRPAQPGAAQLAARPGRDAVQVRRSRLRCSRRAWEAPAPLPPKARPAGSGPGPGLAQRVRARGCPCPPAALAWPTQRLPSRWRRPLPPARPLPRRHCCARSLQGGARPLLGQTLPPRAAPRRRLAGPVCLGGRRRQAAPPPPLGRTRPPLGVAPQTRASVHPWQARARRAARAARRCARAAAQSARARRLWRTRRPAPPAHAHCPCSYLQAPEALCQSESSRTRRAQRSCTSCIW